MIEPGEWMKGAEPIVEGNGGKEPESVDGASAGRRLIVIAGFPGAGKTRLASRLGVAMKSRGIRVAVVLPGRAEREADETLLLADGFSDDEIWAQWPKENWLKRGSTPDVLIVEASDSLTDPAGRALELVHPSPGNEVKLAPLSVVIDPVRAARVFGLERGASFSSGLEELYRQQLSEAGVIVLNKADQLDGERLRALTDRLKQELPEATVCSVSGRTGEGMEEWLQCVMSREHRSRSHSGTGNAAEALLASLNCTVQLSSVKYWDSGKVLIEIATGIQNLLQAEGAEVAHLKMVLIPNEELGELAAVNLVRSDWRPELSREVSEPILGGKLLLNMKAEADPETLHAAMNRALLAVVEKHVHLFVRMEYCEHFRLGKAA